METNTKNSQPAVSANLQASLPHIAYIVLWYPLFTQPFIFREAENLARQLPLQVYSLYGQNLKYCSEEMKKNAMKPETYGAKSFFRLFASLCSAVFKTPRKLGTLFRKCCLRPWGSAETFGENLWGFCVGVHLAKRLPEEGIDLIYAPWPRGAATAALVASSLSGIPFAVAARGDNLDPADPDLADKFDAALFVRANNRADQGRIEKFDRGQAAGKTCLVYNSLTLPVPVGETVKHHMEKPLKILSVGRFDVTKGFDVLIRACARLKELGVPFHLTLAGGGGRIMGLGNLESQLRGLRKELRLEEEISMPGLISHDRLPELLEANDVFAAPCIIHESGRRDGIPNTVIEAMFYGLTVVATDVNALPEVIENGKTGLLVRPNDPEALAKALAWLAQNPDSCEQLGKNASIFAKKMFDPDENARKLAEIFKNADKGFYRDITEKCAE